MKTISKQQLKDLCQNGTHIDSIGEYPSVIIHPDGTITKLWKRKKSLFSSDRFRSYAQRFIDNATGLTDKGINVPDILNHAVLEGERIRIVSTGRSPAIAYEIYSKTLLSESTSQRWVVTFYHCTTKAFSSAPSILVILFYYPTTTTA
jgi:hypothetical protein